MFERILFPTDFSEVARLAEEHLTQLAPVPIGEVTVLHVIDAAAMMSPPAPGSFGTLGISPSLNQAAIDEWQRSASAECERVTARLRAAGVPARAEVRVGHPATVILQMAADMDATLIVIGSTGKGRLAELVLGSVSDEVVRTAHVPLLVAKPKLR